MLPASFESDLFGNALAQPQGTDLEAHGNEEDFFSDSAPVFLETDMYQLDDNKEDEAKEPMDGKARKKKNKDKQLSGIAAKFRQESLKGITAEPMVIRSRAQGTKSSQSSSKNAKGF